MNVCFPQEEKKKLEQKTFVGKILNSFGEKKSPK